MALTDILGKLMGGSAPSIIKSVAEIADEYIQTPAEKEAFKAEITKEVNRHAEEVAKAAQNEAEAYLKDIDSARQMQIAALGQADTFSKRFIYYLASAVIILVFAFDFCLFGIKYPPENRDMINFLSGILNSTALVMVLSFFFGSSMGSKNKGEQMEKNSSK